MTNLKKRSVLVLNSAYEPLSFCSAQRAICLIYKGVAKVETENDTKIHTAKMWDDKTGEFILVDQYLPTVIRLLNYKYIPIRMQLLTRKNILNRDRNTCQYCGKVFPPSQLTLDHILPRCKGGLSTWENLVASCKTCNNRKDNRLLEDIPDMALIHRPNEITVHTSRFMLRNMGAEDPDWRKYLFFDRGEENQWTGE
jgi:hypothetical protein